MMKKVVLTNNEAKFIEHIREHNMSPTSEIQNYLVSRFITGAEYQEIETKLMRAYLDGYKQGVPKYFVKAPKTWQGDSTIPLYFARLADGSLVLKSKMMDSPLLKTNMLFTNKLINQYELDAYERYEVMEEA